MPAKSPKTTNAATEQLIALGQQIRAQRKSLQGNRIDAQRVLSSPFKAIRMIALGSPIILNS